MSKLCTFLLCLCLPLAAAGSCGPGTLACTKLSGSPSPTVCDFFDSYTLNQETLSCVKTSVPNCLIPGLPNSTQICFLCNFGFVIDAEQKSCAPVPEQSKKENCEQYSNLSFSCLKCAPEHYVASGACVPLGEAKIENCVAYASPSECGVCAPGTFLEEGKCKIFASLQNCYFHRNIKCAQCNDQHFHNSAANPSFNSSAFGANTFDYSMFFQFSPAFAHWTRQFSSQVCQRGSIKNCKVYDSFSTCKECEAGYYRNSSMQCDRLQEPPIPGCATYSATTVCSKCQFEFILNLSSGTCSPATQVDSCTEYHLSEDRCVRCESKYFLNSSGGCSNDRIDSLSIKDCQLTAPDKDECAECKLGYSLSFQNKFCYKDILNCEAQTKSNEVDPFHTCSTCKEGFHPTEDRSKCEETKILRCVEIVPQKHECQKCEDQYYFDAESKQCNNQFVENCAEYTPMTNTCVKCNNLFFLVNGICQPIMLSEYCSESDGLTNSCAKCKPQYLKSGNTCDVNNTRSLDVIDSQCKSNNETVKSSNCTDCGPDHYILAGTVRAFIPEVLTAQYCAKINPENGDCLQCVENSSGDGAKCLAPQSDLTTDCLQLKEGAFSTLGTSNCAKCRDLSKKYLNPLTSSCSTRTNPTVNENCDEYPLDDGDCLACKTGFFPVFESEIRDQCFATASIPGYTGISGCTIYNAQTSTCFLCDPGRVLSATGQTCDVYAYSVPIFFDSKMALTNPDLNANNTEFFKMINNCKTYHQLDTNKVRCAECNIGFVNIVKTSYNDEDPLVYDYNSAGINVGLGAFSLPVEKCEPFSNSYIKESGGAAITTDFCEVGVQYEDKPGYACIRCKLNRNGSVVSLNKDKDGLALGATIKGLNACYSSSNITNTYSGVGYHLRYLPNYVPYVIYMRYSDCTNREQSLVFNSVVNVDGTVSLEIVQSLGGVSPIMFCKDLRTNNFFYQDNPNCQIFGFTALPSPTHNAENPPVDLCLACKPGFKAVVTPGTGRIQSCEPIVGCSNPANGKYLNGCSEPTHGYKLDTVENNQLILFDDVLQAAGTVPNCLVYSDDLVKCVVCNPNFSLVLGSCIDVAAAVEYNCASPGFGLNALNLDFALNANQRLMNYTYFLINKFNLGSQRKSLCASCDLGHVVAVFPDRNKLKCHPIAGIEEAKKVPNCLKYKLASPTSCSVCESAYIPNDFSGKCVPKTNYPNCLTVTGFSQFRCNTCAEGFALNETGQCISANCSRWFQKKCVLCSDGFKFKENNDQFCERNLDSVDPCLAYSPTMKTCGKCKNSQVLYHFYEHNGTEHVFQGFSCDQGLLIPSSLPGWKDYNLNEVFVKADFNPSIQALITSLQFINNDDLEPRVFTNTNVDLNPASSHCFQNRQVENCVPEFLHGGVFCSKCQNGFIIDKATNSCKTGTIQNCGVYSSDTECELCLPTHYKFNSGFCSPYNANMNCLESNPDKNECKTCPENFFLNSSKFCEQRRTDLNCKDFETFDNKCTSCLEGFIFDSSTRTCLKRTAKFCEEVETAQDKCKKCKPNYWMDNANNKLCRALTTVEHCKEYEPEKDACKVCTDEFYAVEEGKRCKERPDGVIACEMYSDFGKCSRCLKEHFLANNQCVKVTNLVDNCEYYVSDGACSRCAQGHFFNQGTNSCEETSIGNCLEFSSATTCSKCEENYVLAWEDLQLACQASEIPDCLLAVGGSTPICLKCAPEKVLSVDKTKCESALVSILNCEEYHSSIQCKRCKTGFILSKDWKSCAPKPLSASAIQTNCLSEVYSREVLCDMCKPGFKKNDKGECTKCGGEGCAVCGAGYDSCNLCAAGFHMNSELKCMSNSSSSASDFTASS